MKGICMDMVEAVESYLTDTGQIHPLAKRQASLLGKSVKEKNEQQNARLVLLLNLAALNKGAPRAPLSFLLKPFEKHIAGRYVELFIKENGDNPEWENVVLSFDLHGQLKKNLLGLIDDPTLFAPVSEESTKLENAQNQECFPLLVVDRDGKRMGFSLYWYSAARLEYSLYERLNNSEKHVSRQTAQRAIAEVFSNGELKYHFRQIAAAALALRSSFLVLSGAPGSGKTRVVLQILRVLLHAFPQIEPDRIILCAPTGRAKARLGESILEGVSGLVGESSGKANIREMSLKNIQCRTLHSLLGIRPDGRTKFHKGNPLPYQVIVVDEASMVDLCRFSDLVDAAPSDCRIILVGDMHQLPSVEAGAVLGDLTEHFSSQKGYPTLTNNCFEWVREVIGSVPVDSEESERISLVLKNSPEDLLADRTVILNKSYRSNEAIVKLSALVNSGASEEAHSYIENCTKDTIILDSRSGFEPIKEWLRKWYCNNYLELLEKVKTVSVSCHEGRNLMTKVFQILDRSRILTLSHGGHRGRVEVNRLAAELLRPKLDVFNRGRFFHGEQIMVRQNHHDLDLYNGDMGMTLEFQGELKAVFLRGSQFIVHPLSRLPDLESAFAMTVHKAQGSEFDGVLLVLPEYRNFLLNRQILYTGITRAKSTIRILGEREIFSEAIRKKEERPGGINLNAV